VEYIRLIEGIMDITRRIAYIKDSSNEKYAFNKTKKLIFCNKYIYFRPIKKIEESLNNLSILKVSRKNL